MNPTTIATAQVMVANRFSSKENLALLHELGYSYLINITRGSRQKYADEFAASGFEMLPDRAENQQVEVRKITDPEDADSVLVLCRSAQRRLKEVAMISTAEKRSLTGSKPARPENSS